MSVPDTKLRHAKPADKPYRIQVGGNLYLEVLTTGTKVWRMRYRKPDTKSEAMYTFGYYPQLSQVEARSQSLEIKQLVKDGINPIEYKKAQKLEEKLKRNADQQTFKSVTLEWHKHRLGMGKWKPDHAAKILRSFENDVFPTIGDYPIIKIDAPILLGVIKPIVERGAIETSKKLNQRISAVFRFAIVRKIITTNPSYYLRDELPSVEVSHNPHLTPDQIPAFISAIESSQARETVKLAILLTMHTLTRTSEIRLARWHEFDLDNKVWNIPAERMKMGKPHSVPLSTQSMAILARLKKTGKNTEYLFTTTNRHKPMSENAMLNVLYKAGYKGIITIHGLRGTGSTILNEQQYRFDVIESALAHIDPNKVRGAYNHAEYFEERRVMMQDYSTYLDSLIHA